MPKSKKKQQPSILRDVVDLFYPNICPGCKGGLLSGEALICIDCIFDLPYTNIANQENNLVEERLAGKVSFNAATALCYFRKASVSQALIHALKYKKNTEVGLYLGEMLGNTLLRSTRFNDIDYVVPVPLHPQKLKARGYNQSKFIAEGVYKANQAEPIYDNLVRLKHTNTQTTKSIYDRWQNVSKIFGVNNKDEFEGKHILIVDDVITSGSTLEGCVTAFDVVKGVKISVAVLACAE